MSTLVVAPNWIGDAVMAQPLLADLAAQGQTIDVLAPHWVADVFAHMPQVRHVYRHNLPHKQLNLRLRWALAKQLQQQYQQCFVLPNSLKSALIPFFARIPKRVGYLGEQRYGLINTRPALLLDTSASQQARYRHLRTALPSRVELDSNPPQPRVQALNKQAAQNRLQQAFPPYAALNQLVALCPGAEFGAAKRWPYYAALAKVLLERNQPCILLGSAKDKDLTQDIVQQNQFSPLIVDFAGETTVSQAIDLLSCCHTVVCNDSGLMHIAAALNIHTVAIYGSSDPRKTPPAADCARVLWLALSCAPCLARECPLGTLDCLKQLTVQNVLHEIPFAKG